MLDETFAEAIVHRRRGHRVLGLRLRPFSFWHAANLDFIGSPFAASGVTLDFAALVLAVEVCRLRYPQSLGNRHSAIGICLAWLYGRDYLNQLNAFCLYLRDYNSGPVYGEKDDAKPLACPWYLVGACQTLHNNGGPVTPRTLAAAWDAPVGLSTWYNAAHAEVRGNTPDILTPELREAFSSAGIEI